MIVLLIGPRGCGKTTVGRVLAQRLGMPFLDLDEVVLSQFAEPSIREVWARHGESAWRKAEERAVADLGTASALVVALGGGAAMIPAAQAMILRQRADRRACVVYLHCRLDELLRRLEASPGDRPPLTTLDWRREVETVVAQREPTYLRLADLVVDASDLAAADAASQVANWLKDQAQ